MTTKSKRPEITFDEPEPAAPPPKASAHLDGCSCHKDVGGYCCGADSLRLIAAGGVKWHVDPACPWRPEV